MQPWKVAPGMPKAVVGLPVMALIPESNRLIPTLPVGTALELGAPSVRYRIVCPRIEAARSLSVKRW